MSILHIFIRNLPYIIIGAMLAILGYKTIIAPLPDAADTAIYDTPNYCNQRSVESVPACYSHETARGITVTI